MYSFSKSKYIVAKFSIKLWKIEIALIFHYDWCRVNNIASLKILNLK